MNKYLFSFIAFIIPLIIQGQNISFKDSEVKRICVANWDSDKDGELSYSEAAKVTELWDAFSSKDNITSFDEFQYFTGLTSIGEQAFRDCSKLRSIIFPNNVISVGMDAFQGCISLPVEDNIRYADTYLVEVVDKSQFDIHIKNGTLFIGNYAFSDCTNLISITIPNNVISIGAGAFYGCYNLETINIPNSVTVIESYAFMCCYGMTSITIPSSVKLIDDNAFHSCYSLTSMIVAPGNTNYDSRNNCNAIIETSSNTLIAGCQNTIIPFGVTSIKDCAFEACTTLKSIIIPNSVTKIGYSAFNECSNLKSVTISNSVIDIGEYAFSSTALTSITIPNRLEIVNAGMFAGCHNLTSVTIPRSVTNIMCSAFYDCSRLSLINIENPNPINFCENEFSNCPYLIICVPAGSKANYEKSKWNELGDIVENDDSNIIFADLTVMALCVANWDTDGDGELSMDEAAAVKSLDNIFKDRTDIISFNELQFFTGLKLIEYESFAYCSKLTSVTIPNSVTSIGYGAFGGCTKLSSITIPNSVLSIGTGAFNGCTSLNTINIPNSVKSIGSNSFEDCTNLTSINIPLNVTIIKDWTFHGCSSLTSLNIPHNVTSIGEHAFDSCSGLQSITIPESVTNIGSYAFSCCYSLTSITIPDNVISINEETFSNCSSLTSITIPNNVMNIGQNAFRECSKLTSVDIPNSVTNIEGNPFVACFDLSAISVESGNKFYDSRNNCNAIIETSTNTLITGCHKTIIPNSIIEIGSHAFSFCTNLTSIIIPKSVTNIGDGSFSGCSALTSIIIPSSVTNIENSSFSGCSALTSITIPSSVTNIGAGAFMECSNLTSIVIPHCVMSIGNCAFESCSNLKSVTVKWEKPLVVTSNIFLKVPIDHATLFVPIGSKAAYEEAPVWNNFGTIIEKEASDITFADTKVKSLCVDNWDTDFDGELSYNEASEVAVLGTVFKNSKISSFNELQYFTGLTSINTGAFSNSTVKNITLPENITSLGKDAFLYCRSLTGIHLPAKMQTIGQNALSGCSAMTSITVDEQNGAFCDVDGVLFSKDKTSLVQFPAAKTTAYSVPSGTEIIERDAFYESGLESVVLPTTLTELGYDAFGYSTKLTELTIPEGVTTIGDYILDYCTALKTLHIPASVQSIGQRITNDCKAITDVYSDNKSPFAINSNNFTTATYSNATLHVPYGMIELYSFLDGWKNFQNIVDDITVSPYAHAEGSNMYMGRQFDVSVGFFTGSGRYNGYQFDISFPEGFRLQEKGGSYSYELSDRFNNEGMSVSISKNSNGSYRVMVFSTTNARIKENDGELIRLVAVADKDMEAGEYAGCVYSAMLSKSNGENIDVEPGPFFLVIPEYELGDVNNDNVVDVTDVMLVVNHILGNTLSFFQGAYADMNGDGIIDVTDIMLIVSVILDSERM
jgi:hypothetical protein